ncbi:peptidoglycan-binding protein [Streptomyces sp. BB1-1-1]|uniref:peptidoglycan-binding protein n=1 Tax=Streptomyces sp. BB1-1-1 TaxID=3074430 RepID=UPI002877CE3A|nr:peptidoglycan-binding protein [Streptomyces sp. BB1-1-1]WND37835.1 peptidoglycan-binding protein [Streptomyces sp. BB1-1-1]
MEQQKEPPREPRERPQGHSCPECGTPREADNTPACACGSRASDALRDARTAQAAAAEDFDPLRIRPYVELDGGAGEPGTPETPGARGTVAPSGASSSGAPTSGTPSEPVSAAAHADSASPSASVPPSLPDPDATMTLRAVGAEPPGATTETTSTLPTPLAPSAGPPSAHDLRLFETSPGSSAAPFAPGEPAGPGADGTGGRPPRKRRRSVLLSAAGAVVVVVGAAGYASGLFSYETPSRDGALPDEVRASVPAPSTSEASATPESSAPSAPETSAAPSPSASASPSASPSSSPSPSASSASPTPSRSAEPTRSTTTAPADGPTQESEDEDRVPDGGGTLQRGDRGPEVVELQQRLAQLHLYTGDTNGNYNRQVEDAVRTYQWARGIRDDALGVYGQVTRGRLESETREP